MCYYMKKEEDKIFDFIVSNNIATEEEVALVNSVAGYSVENLNAIIYARTSYHDAEQCLTCEPDAFFDIYNDFTSEDEEDDDEDECEA